MDIKIIRIIGPELSMDDNYRVEYTINELFGERKMKAMFHIDNSVRDKEKLIYESIFNYHKSDTSDPPY